MSHVVNLGDCLAGMDTLPDCSIDHVVCDPPYGEEAHTKQRRTKSGTQLEPIMDFASLDFASLDFASRAFARLVRRWVIVFCQVEQVDSWRKQLMAHGLDYVRTAVWIKPDGQPQYTGDRPGMGYESIVIAHRKGRKRWNGGGKHGVWRFNRTGPDDVERTGHQTQKPLALMECLLRDFTDPGDLILDPFAGSGTTGVACKRMGRDFIGWELNEKYQRIAQHRIDATNEQLELVRHKAPKAKQGAFKLAVGE